VRELTKPFVYNDISSLEKIFQTNKGNVAAVIMEPMNYVEPQPGFLESVKHVAHENGALLIFDEICTGWHFGLGGAQKHFGVTPDLSCFGKAMGNGFPIACIVGREDIMRQFEEIFVSFTFAGEVASMAASMEVIRILETEQVIETLVRNGAVIQDTINRLARDHGIGQQLECIGKPQWSLIRFRDQHGNDSIPLKSLFQQEVIKRGILILATHNMNYALKDSDLKEVVGVYEEVIPYLADAVKTGTVEQRLEGTMIQAIFKIR
jgi:glutamate-1-semialdehyde aminotransferase